MDLDRELYKAFRQEAELPAPVQAGLERTYDKLRAKAGAEDLVQIKVSKKFVRTLLIAAMLATFFSITAFAATFLGRMNYQANLDEKLSYRWDNHNTSFSPALVLNFDMPEEGNLYFFRPDWLPSEPQGDPVTGGIFTAYSYLSLKAWGEAEGTLEQLIAQSGLSEEELEQWYYRCENAPAYGKIPYQIQILSPFRLYAYDFLVGQYGGHAEIVSEQSEGEWYKLDVAITYEEGSHGDDDLVNYIFRFNQEEGYLITVFGTEELATLDKIADHIQVVKTGIVEHFSGDLDVQNYACLDLGRG